MTKKTEQAVALLNQAQTLLQEAPFPTQTPVADRSAEALNAGNHAGHTIGRLAALRDDIELSLVPHEATGPEPYAKTLRAGRPHTVVVDEEGVVRYANS